MSINSYVFHWNLLLLDLKSRPKGLCIRLDSPVTLVDEPRMFKGSFKSDIEVQPGTDDYLSRVKNHIKINSVPKTISLNWMVIVLDPEDKLISFLSLDWCLAITI